MSGPFFSHFDDSCPEKFSLRMTFVFLLNIIVLIFERVCLFLGFSEFCY